jgi:hypothetical protein
LKRREWLFVLAALLSVGAYIVISALRGILSGVEGIGFPLDDSWIHQVYARNLATRGEFTFFAGQPSAGSTSPLWTLLLAIGYLLRMDFRAWTYLLGFLLLGASAIVAACLAERLFTFYPFDYAQGKVLRLTSHLTSLIFPLFLIFEWHLAWSAASGMEIPLFVFLSLILLERFYARDRAWLLGLLAGLLMLTRPEGVVLTTLVGIGIALCHAERSEASLSLLARFFPVRYTQGLRASLRMSIASDLAYALGFAVVVAPYVLFNFATSGTIFPNTFYAKSAEYAVLFARVPLVVRWLQLLLVPWVGAQILLLPGALYIVAALARKRQWVALIPAVWLLLLPALYALRLPVTYQHGRYEMPVIPFIVLYGIWGTVALIARLRNWFVRTTWALSTGVVLIAFWFIGAAQYATDVAVIDCEMVQTARWVAANVPPDAVVAAHDIGALGYFYDRPFVDLAGLVTPEVIPFIRDEGRLREYLFSRHATFVIVFPDWYPTFDSDPRFVPMYQTNCAVTRGMGEKNMVVYRIVE